MYSNVQFINFNILCPVKGMREDWKIRCLVRILDLCSIADLSYSEMMLGKQLSIRLSGLVLVISFFFMLSNPVSFRNIIYWYFLGKMSEYSTEKVLQWVNSSEAKAAKYEQEAKVGLWILLLKFMMCQTSRIFEEKLIFWGTK